MKIGPNPNFPVQLVRASFEARMEKQENYSLYDGIYSLLLNHIVDLYFLPAVDERLLTHETVVLTNPTDIETVEGARAQIAMFANAVVTPHREFGGQDVVVPIADVPVGDTDNAGQSVTFLYVSPSEYEELYDELSGIVQIIEAPYDPDAENQSDFEDRFNDRHNAPTIDEIEHLKIGQFIKSRVLTSKVVRTHMLRDPGDEKGTAAR